MVVKIYEKPVQGQPLKRVGITRSITGEYEAGFYEYGRFALSCHLSAPFAGELKKKRILCIDNTYWAVIRNRKIQRGASNTVTVSGYQIKGILWQRITIPLDMPPANAPAGFDSQAGYTSRIMDYFVSQNTQGTKRHFENFTINDPDTRGNSDDKYYTRFEVLSDVAAKIGTRSKVGWDIIGNERTGEFTMVTMEGVDRSVNQSVRAPIIFDINLGTLSDFEYSEESEQSANVFYCTKSGAEFEDEALTQTYFLDDIEAVGMDRMEKHLNVSIGDDEDLFTEMEETARKEMENYRETTTISVTTTKKLIPGIDYNNGDIVTFRSREDGISADRQITAVKMVSSEVAENWVITLGEPRLDRLDFIARDVKNK